MKTRKNTKHAAMLALIAILFCTLIAGVTLLTLPQTVMTASAEELTYTDVTEAWNAAVESSSADNAVEFKLTDNWQPTATITVPEGKNIILDLNGKTIDGSNNGGDRVITIKAGGTLTLEDSSAYTDADDNYISGKITGGNGGVSVYSDVYRQVPLFGTFTMNNGIITGNKVPSEYDSGGGVYISGGTFTMNGGLISDNVAGRKGGGVCVSDYGATFIMNGGLITGNEAGRDGGGVCTDYSAYVIMNGGTITGNKSGTSVEGGLGGGVYIGGGGSFKLCVFADGEPQNEKPIIIKGNETVYSDKSNEIILNKTDVIGDVVIYDNTYDKAIELNGKVPENSVICVGRIEKTGSEVITKNYKDYLTKYPDATNPSKIFRNNKYVIKLNEDNEACVSDTLAVSPEVLGKELTYNGNEQTVTVTYDTTVNNAADKVEYVSGDFAEASDGVYTVKDAGTYSIILKIKDEYAETYGWADGTEGEFELSWTIKRARLGEITIAESKDISGGNATIDIPENVGATVKDYNWTVEDGKIKIPDDADDGEYTLTLTPDKNHIWADGSTGAKDFTFSVSGGKTGGGDNTGDNPGNNGGNGGDNSADIGGNESGNIGGNLSWEWTAFIVVGSVAIVLFIAGTVINIILIRKDKKKAEEEAMLEKSGFTDGETK